MEEKKIESKEILNGNKKESVLSENVEEVEIVKVICELLSLLEGYDHKKNSKNGQLTIKTKILIYLLDQKAGPFYLTKKIGVAKTNLNILCNELIRDGFVRKNKEDFDKRIVLYEITDKGKEHLLKELKSFENNIKIGEKKLALLSKKLKEILQILN